MDFNKIIARAKALLLSPKTEWPAIASETETTQGLYVGYVIPLAAAPAIAGFIKSSVIGTAIPFVGGTYRSSIGGGLSAAVITFLMSLVGVFILGLIIDALAPTFGATKDRMQALKTAAYAYTASWVAGILVIVPGIGWLVALLGGLYSLYLLFLGLPFTMKAPEDKTVGYTIVTVIAAIVLSLILGAITAGVVGTAGLGGLARSGSFGSSAVTSDDSGSITGGALGGVNLAGLAALRNEGVKAAN